VGTSNHCEKAEYVANHHRNNADQLGFFYHSRILNERRVSNENEILHSWRHNAAQWIHTVQQRLIASRAYTDGAIRESVLRRRPEHVLDVGCGEGWLVRSLVQAGVDACGADGSRTLLTAAAAYQKGRFVAATYDEIVANPATLGGPYDVAVFNFSLLEEHIAPLLRAVSTLLTDDGAIVIQTLHPLTANGGDYAGGWRVETFAGIAGKDWKPMPWFFRTLEGWMDVFRESGLRLERLVEPRNDQTGQVVSVLFELTPR